VDEARHDEPDKLLPDHFLDNADDRPSRTAKSDADSDIVGRGFSITTFTHGHAKRSVVPRLGASRRPPTPEAVDRDAAWTPRTRPPLLGKRADAFPTLPTAVHRLGKSKKRDPRLRAGRNQTILMALPRGRFSEVPQWPHLNVR
jgi:hypothetical protein